MLPDTAVGGLTHGQTLHIKGCTHESGFVPKVKILFVEGLKQRTVLYSIWIQFGRTVKTSLSSNLSRLC